MWRLNFFATWSSQPEFSRSLRLNERFKKGMKAMWRFKFFFVTWFDLPSQDLPEASTWISNPCRGTSRKPWNSVPSSSHALADKGVVVTAPFAHKCKRFAWHWVLGLRAVPLYILCPHSPSSYHVFFKTVFVKSKKAARAQKIANTLEKWGPGRVLGAKNCLFLTIKIF